MFSDGATYTECLAGFRVASSVQFELFQFYFGVFVSRAAFQRRHCCIQVYVRRFLFYFILFYFLLLCFLRSDNLFVVRFISHSTQPRELTLVRSRLTCFPPPPPRPGRCRSTSTLAVLL